jgi:cytochrome c oxidase cbb3-type subunit III
MRRALVSLGAAIVGIGIFTGGLAWLLTDPRPPAGTSRGERLYYAYCVECHGVDGRGSWRAALFLLKPGNLAERSRRESDRYLFDIIKHGGAPIGRPGMPAFGSQLSDADIEMLVAYIRSLPDPASARH